MKTKSKTKKNRSRSRSYSRSHSRPHSHSRRSSTCKNKLNSSFVQKLRKTYARSFCGKKSKCIKQFNTGFKRGFMKTCIKKNN
jgi:hypothetical protein